MILLVVYTIEMHLYPPLPNNTCFDHSCLIVDGPSLVWIYICRHGELVYIIMSIKAKKKTSFFCCYKMEPLLHPPHQS